jgi:PAS domain S-box-containing protein
VPQSFAGVGGIVKTSQFARIVGCLSCLVIIGSNPVNAEDPSPFKRVLLLRQTGMGFQGTARFDAEFVDALRTADSVPFEVNGEAVETRPGAERFFVDYLKSKYAERRIDVIVAIGAPALRFARGHRQMFGNPPIVTATSLISDIDQNDNITGVQAGQAVSTLGTADLARALRPDTCCVVVVDAIRGNTGDLEAEIRRRWAEQAGNLRLIYFRDLRLDELTSRLATIPKQSIVVFARQTIRTEAEDVDQFEALSRVVETSPVPVFTTVDDFIGRGAVGGYLWSFSENARRLADMTRRITNGVSTRDVPIERGTYTNMLDWRQLQRWQIAESRVPAGSAVLFRPESLFDRYFEYVVGGVVVFAAQFALILGLLVQRAQRHRAEEESRKSNLRYQSVVDAQSDFICRFLPDTTLTFVNDAYCRFWNKPREELLGHKFIELIPPAARDGVTDRLGRLSQGVDSHEHAVCLPDGTEGWHHWINQPFFDQHGRMIEVQGVGRDVTDRKRAEAALRIAQDRNTAILRAIPDMMFVLRRDGTYVDYHVRDLSLLHLPPEQFIGRTIREIMPPQLAEAMMNALERSCATREPVVIEYELPFGEGRHYEARLVPSANDQVLSIVRDVTEATRARELNRALAGRLIVSQEEERQRIARELHDDLSHKIALLNIDVDRLAHQMQRSEHRLWLRNISAQVTEIAGNLHELSYELHPARLQTLGLVESLRALCSEFSQQREISVVFTSTGKELPMRVDPALALCLYRITQEALHNVARHSRALHAAVRLAYEGDDVSLQIADSGVGFEMRRDGHTGLGLVSMRERVGILNGQLSIHSAPGRGTRITAQIPLTLPAMPQPHTDSVSQSA